MDQLFDPNQLYDKSPKGQCYDVPPKESPEGIVALTDDKMTFFKLVMKEQELRLTEEI